MTPRSRALLSGVSSLLLTAGPAGASNSGPEPAGPPRLILVISVDQFRADYLSRFEPALTGGLRTLLTRGAVFTSARYAHSPNETGPGHCVIASGRHGRHTGIVANEWLDPITRHEINVVEDPVHAPVGGIGRGASPTHFLGFTLGDLLKRHSPASRVVGVAMKDRSAVLLAGRRADAAYWYADDGGRFISSTYYYMSGLPPWLAAWNERRRADVYSGRSWTRLLEDEEPYLRLAGPDAVEGEWDRVDTTFPHRLRGEAPEPEFYFELRRTPFIDALTLEVALEAMAAHGLGQDEATDVLGLGLSATDVIGHTYGPDSQEVMDQVLRLDRNLALLFEEVDRRVGLDRTVVVLTSDHGVAPLAEVARARGLEARRASPAFLDAALRRALAERFPGGGEFMAHYRAPDFYLDLEAIRRRGLKREEVEAVAEKALLETGIVAGVYTHARLLGEAPPDDPFFPLFRNSFFEPRSPHLLVRLREHVYLDNRPGGAGHGQPYDDDRHVPLVFLGGGMPAGTFAQPCGPQDIAPTLASILGLEYVIEEGQQVLGPPRRGVPPGVAAE